MNEWQSLAIRLQGLLLLCMEAGVRGHHWFARLFPAPSSPSSEWSSCLSRALLLRARTLPQSFCICPGTPIPTDKQRCVLGMLALMLCGEQGCQTESRAPSLLLPNTQRARTF